MYLKSCQCQLWSQISVLMALLRVASKTAFATVKSTIDTSNSSNTVLLYLNCESVPTYVRFDWSIWFIMLQRGTNIMANQVKTTIQNYFEKSVVWKFDIWGSSLVFFLRVVSRGITKNRNKPLWLNVCMMIPVNFHSTIIDELKKNIFLTFDHCRIRFSVYHQWLNIFLNSW
jgi:hypothetical protein